MSKVTYKELNVRSDSINIKNQELQVTSSMLNVQSRVTSQYNSRMSRVTSYDQLSLAKKDLLPNTDSIRLPNPCQKIFTSCDYSESRNFLFDQII